MNKNGKDKNANKDSKTHELMEVGGVVIEINNQKENAPFSAVELEKQLREGGIEVIEGKNSPEDDAQIS